MIETALGWLLNQQKRTGIKHSIIFNSFAGTIYNPFVFAALLKLLSYVLKCSLSLRQLSLTSVMFRRNQFFDFNKSLIKTLELGEM